MINRNNNQEKIWKTGSIALLISIVIFPLIDFQLAIFGINVPVLRYSVNFFSLFFLAKLYVKVHHNSNRLPITISILIRFLIFLVLIQVVLSYNQILSPYNNYVFLKATFSGYLLIYVSFLFTNLTWPLVYFKWFLKLGFYLNIIFLAFVIPGFSYFASTIENGAEQMVRYYGAAGVYVFLLFPFQKRSTNIITFLTFFLSVLLMLLIARRNLVLYLGGVSVLMSLLIIFANVEILKQRRKILVFGSIITILFSILAIYIGEFKFDLFLERASTGMESRVDVFEEFTKDFNTSPIDWFTGRGIFGGYYSRIADDEVTNQRLLIENGYYQYILKNGFLFLIPFVLLSIYAIVMGLFKSNNLLAKASAILVLANLIDMIGYGLPFLGLKYLNFLFAFGFCLSKELRNLRDSDLKIYLKI